MTDTLARLRQVLAAEGFSIDEEAPKTPPGSFVARRGATKVLVHVSNGSQELEAGIRQRFRVAAHEQRPLSTDIAATAQVPGLRKLLVIER